MTEPVRCRGCGFPPVDVGHKGSRTDLLARSITFTLMCGTLRSWNPRIRHPKRPPRCVGRCGSHGIHEDAVKAWNDANEK